MVTIKDIENLIGYGGINNWDDILDYYSSPHRHYHNMTHIWHMLCALNDVEDELDYATQYYVAAIYHDCVYEPGSKTNESRSAMVARNSIGWERDSYEDNVCRLINLTARHGIDAHFHLTCEEDALFLDADMAILGESEVMYKSYSEGIRKEYAFAPDEAYNAGRAFFLKGLLNSDRIFLSDTFHNLLDEKARINIERELKCIGQ